MSRLIALALMLCVGACAHAPGQRLQLPEPRIAPGDMRLEVSMVQRLSFDRGSHRAVTPTIEAQLEIDSDAVRFAGFAAAQRVLGFVWDGHELSEQRSAQLPAHVLARHILRDVQYVYAPVEALRAALPAEWSVEESPRLRQIRWRDQQRAAVRIVYSDAIRVRGDVHMQNWADRYLLKIESADSAATESD